MAAPPTKRVAMGQAEVKNAVSDIADFQKTLAAEPT